MGQGAQLPQSRLTSVRSLHWLSQDQEMRLKKLDCERNTCSHLTGESRMNCQYKCISEPCYHEIYGHDEVASCCLPYRVVPNAPPTLCAQRTLLCTVAPALTSLPPLQLEEGEVDTERGRLFGFCYRRFFRAEMEERKERVRKESAEQRARLSEGMRS